MPQRWWTTTPYLHSAHGAVHMQILQYTCSTHAHDSIVQTKYQVRKNKCIAKHNAVQYYAVLHGTVVPLLDYTWVGGNVAMQYTAQYKLQHMNSTQR